MPIHKRLRSGAMLSMRLCCSMALSERGFCWTSWWRWHTKTNWTGRLSWSRPTSTPLLWMFKRPFLAIWPSKKKSPRSCAGMLWRWWQEQTPLMESWADTSPAMPVPPIYLRWVLTISFMPAINTTAATWCFSSRTVRLAFMQEPI